MENAKTLHAIIETNKNKLKTIKFTFIESYPENGSLSTYDVIFPLYTSDPAGEKEGYSIVGVVCFLNKKEIKKK
ncbi:hypothetical protein, partial [Escherichia coli]|uniref:hypothetical protein n=1 Tax=Escherichia coli TaxID=562 RepID=UPI00197AF875